MDGPVSPSTDLVVSNSASPAQDKLEVWPESLNTPGVLPRHLKREASSQYPLLEILQRLLYRLRPDTHNDLDKVLAAIALYSAVVPVYKHLKNFALWAFTVEITIPEHDA
jgi:chaperone BCS1